MNEPQEAYRVLARKYRPRNFSELVGQDALVRTLTNAIQSNRIAHAFMLTGVRGVGKTTTARIIARAINYTGADGTAGPTAGPTDDCALCQAIAEDRHPDVMEMDAASRTGVDDIREILDGVRYAPTSARYKVYIIDEVHMLSKQAFNALLKTLEEPPPHVKFIFATTEIRKVPVTVLSRCQRFDLRRVDVPTLKMHFANICGKENVQFEDAALLHIARAADGSVRDGLSLLDRAIARSEDNCVHESTVIDMLGLADKGRLFGLFMKIMQGQSADALTILDDLFASGADGLTVLQDLCDICHDIALMRAVEGQPQALKDSNLPLADLQAAQDAAKLLTMPSLHRAWGLLLKGIAEIQQSTNMANATRIALLRLLYAADLPDPARLLRDIQSGAFTTAPAPAAATGAVPSNTTIQLKTIAGGAQTAPQIAAVPEPQLNTLEAAVAYLQDKNELILAGEVARYVRPVRFETGRIEFEPSPECPANLPQRLSAAMQTLTGQRWLISISSAKGGDTLMELKKGRIAALRAEVLEHPHIKAVFDAFPGTELRDIIETKQKP